MSEDNNVRIDDRDALSPDSPMRTAALVLLIADSVLIVLLSVLMIIGFTLGKQNAQYKTIM